jgi:hypothetical protein
MAPGCDHAAASATFACDVTTFVPCVLLGGWAMWDGCNSAGFDVVRSEGPPRTWVAWVTCVSVWQASAV